MKEVDIFTDGSSRGNPGPGGYGTLIVYGEHEKEISEGFRKTTNNRMEILSAIVGLESLKESCRVNLYSDSRYLIDASNKGWIKKWENSSWKKKDKSLVKNIDLWKRLQKASLNHEIKWNWVKGHSGHEKNEKCDSLATEASNRSLELLLEDEGFIEYT